MILPFPLHLRVRRGLLVYQLVLILVGIIILILALFYVARRDLPENATTTRMRIDTGAGYYVASGAR